jgi:CheY-like chemotaxis protein/anti-sigma regulatory factor (Ser/Thr protein kinase)
MPGDLVRTVRDLVHGFAPLAERKHISLHLNTDLDVLVCRYDHDVLEKALSNLISNAIKFAEPGDEVSIKLGAATIAADSLVTVSVRDTGPGIAEEELPRIFGRFEQVDSSMRRRHEGTGIGLAVAKELVELHGGEITVKSELGTGTTFTIRIPVEIAKVELPDSGDGESTVVDRNEEDPHRPLPNDTNPVLVLVEDNRDVREYLRVHLAADYVIVEADDGEAGLRAIREHHPDLILTDVMMPRMDGYEMCRLLKADDEFSDIPIVMLTAKVDESSTVEGIESGADVYISKPFKITELKARLANLVSTRRALRTRFSKEIFVRPSDIKITPEE